jgi:hypothetical protein
MQPKGEWAAVATLATFAAFEIAACSPQSKAEGGTEPSADATDHEARAVAVLDATYGDAAHVLDAGAQADVLEAGAQADDASILLDAPVDVAATPCDADASDDAGGNYCPPPLSTCADSVHLVYFDWGTCVSGSCVWPQKVMACPLSGACQKGACISTVTAPAFH